MPSDIIDMRNTLYYFIAIAIALISFFIASSYVLLAISVNTGRASELTLVEASIQVRAAQLAKNPEDKNAPLLQAALVDLESQRIGHEQTTNFGDRNYWHLDFQHCAMGFDPECFHRNSSVMNTIDIALASGVLGICLLFFISVRTDSISPTPSMRNLGTLISILCLIPAGMMIGLLTLFLLRGAKGAVLTPLVDSVQMESPFGVAFACTLAAFFSDKILAKLSNIVDHFGLSKTA